MAYLVKNIHNQYLKIKRESFKMKNRDGNYLKAAFVDQEQADKFTNETLAQYYAKKLDCVVVPEIPYE